LIAGDFNLDRNRNQSLFQVFTDILSSFNLDIVLNSPTRITEHSFSCLDNFLTNMPFVNCSIIEPLISDHHAIILEMSLNVVFKNNDFVEFRDYSRQNLLELRTLLEREDWSDMFSASNINDMYDNFVCTVSHCISIACPVRKVRRKKNKKLNWVTDEIKLMKIEVQNSYSEWMSTRCDSKKIAYNKLKREYRRKIREAKSRAIVRDISSSDNISKTCWRFINTQRPQNKTASESNISLQVNDTLIKDPQVVSNIFNNFFLECNINSVSSHIPSSKLNLNCSLNHFKPLTLTELRQILRSLKSKNSAGHDGISSKIIKFCSKQLEYPLLHLVNTSLRVGIFPNSGKLAIVKPLHKKDSKLLPQHYRPISLLPTVSKIIEKAVCQNLIQYFQDHNLLFSKQFGYQKQKSTKLALIDFVNKCIDALEGGDSAIGCFIDLSRAFDCVNHSLLIRKLELLGIGQVALGWLRSYLSDRQQRTTINHFSDSGVKKQFYSNTAAISVGVPQGSILGPILFLVYINDISLFNPNPEESLTIFADDTSLFTHHSNIAELERETFSQLNAISQYFSEIDLRINPSKTKYMFISTDQKKRCLMRAGVQSPSVLLDEDILEECSFVDYLGVRLDDGFRWSEHIDKLASTLTSNIFVLRNLATFNNKFLCRLVYFSLIESFIRYSIVLWGLSSRANLMRIFVIKKKAIRIMSGLKPRDSCKDKFIEFQILTVPSLYIFETVCYVVDNNLIQAHQHSHFTRNRSVNPSVQHRLKLFESKPSYAGLTFFSKLPSHIRNIRDSKKFKGALKNYLVEQCFYELPSLS
jgi:hypothetical protein